MGAVPQAGSASPAARVLVLPRYRERSTLPPHGSPDTPSHALVRRGWSGLTPAANKSSGFLVRSPARLAIGRQQGLGPPNLCDLSQSLGGKEPPPPRSRLAPLPLPSSQAAGDRPWRSQADSKRVVVTRDASRHLLPCAGRHRPHHGARRVAGRVRAALPTLDPCKGAGVRAHPSALGVRVPFPSAALAHLRHLLLHARLGGVQAQQRAAPARAARAGHPEAGERSREGARAPGRGDRAV